MSSENGFASAESFKAENRKTVELSKGRKALIRKVTALEVIQIEAALTMKYAVEIKTILATNMDALRDWYTYMVCASLVLPKVVVGDARVGEMNVQDFGPEDFATIKLEVDQFCLGVSEVAETSFPESDGTANDSQSSEGVRHPAP